MLSDTLKAFKAVSLSYTKVIHIELVIHANTHLPFLNGAGLRLFTSLNIIYYSKRLCPYA